jgi:predicted nuclease of predicted toxin-antitoxin system
MKILTDQDIFRLTVEYLTGLGHDVVTAASLGLSRAADSELLRTAHEQNRIFVARDRDYGNLVFVQGNAPGII